MSHLFADQATCHHSDWIESYATITMQSVVEKKEEGYGKSSDVIKMPLSILRRGKKVIMLQSQCSCFLMTFVSLYTLEVDVVLFL